MACPKIPILREQWNAWMLFATSAETGVGIDRRLDVDDVEDYMLNAFSALDATGFHDLTVVKVTDFADAVSKLDEPAVIWRMEECAPIPAFGKDTAFETYLAKFVVRGTDFELPYETLAAENRALGEDVLLSKAFKQTAPPEVPEEPPGLLERFTKNVKKGIEDATSFYSLLALVAVGVGVWVLTRK
jgi:hypothetical protein